VDEGGGGGRDRTAEDGCAFYRTAPGASVITWVYEMPPRVGVVGPLGRHEWDPVVVVANGSGIGRWRRNAGTVLHSIAADEKKRRVGFGSGLGPDKSRSCDAGSEAASGAVGTRASRPDRGSVTGLK
jgi:hypothetical protein